VTRTNTSVLLVGHGTRDEAGLAEVRSLSARVAEALAPWPVETGFIELAEPTIGGAFDLLIERGVQEVRVVPLLLFAAGHAKADLPQAVREAANVHANVEITIAAPFGLEEQIHRLSQRRFEEALSCGPLVATAEIYWLLVGRGSSDTDAAADLNRFAHRQAARLKLARFGCAFVAAAQPSLEDGLTRAAESASSGVKRIVVQPHLLFRGAVLDEVRTAVAGWRTRCPSIDWAICSHLGPAQELIDVVVEHATVGGS
jgi:sirohydrochlorin cobaltochelatase